MRRIVTATGCFLGAIFLVPAPASAVDPYAAAKGAVNIIRQQAEIGDAAAERRERDAESASRQWGRRGDMLVGSEPSSESSIDFAKYGLGPGGQSSSSTHPVPGTGRSTGWQAAPKVEMFVASQCPHCDELRKFLSEEGIPVTVFDVERDRRAEEDYLANIGRGILPATRIGTTVIRGLEAKRILAEIERQGRSGPPLPSAALGDSFTVNSDSTTSFRRRHATNRGMGRRLSRVLERYDSAVANLSGREKDPSIKTVFQGVSRLEVEEALLRSLVSNTAWFSRNELNFAAKDFEETAVTYINAAKRLAAITQPGEVSEGSLHLLRMRRLGVEKRVQALRAEAGIDDGGL